MTGGNGLPAVQNLSDRLKCPAHPTKRRWVDGDIAREEAERRSKNAKVPIMAYLCDTCGNYHLTKSVGGDSVTLSDGQYSVGEFKAAAPGERVLPTPEDPEPPIVPGDFDTRVRFARRYLEQNPEPTSEEMCEALGGCTRDSLRKVMHALGYRNTRGRSARWVKVTTTDGRTKDDVSRETSGFEVFDRTTGKSQADDPIDVPVIHRTTGKPVNLTPNPGAQQFDGSAQNDQERTTQTWYDVDPQKIGHIAVGDLIATYAAAGLKVRIQVGDHA